jgi:uncharacterized membrane protein YbhN (UPF0104 family)
VSESPSTSGVREAATPGTGLRLRRWFAPLLGVPTPVIFVAAAAIATLFLWRQGSLADVQEAIRAVHPLKLAGILVVYGASILALGVRWHVLVRLAGGRPVWGSSAEVFLTSVIVNYAAPIGLAVPTRAALTVRDLGLSPGPSGAVVGWELGLDVVALSAITLVWLVQGGSVLLVVVPLDRGVLVATIVVAALTIAAVAGVSRVTAVRSRARAILGPMLANPLQRPGLASLAILLTALFWIVQIGIMGALLNIFGVYAGQSLVLGLMGLPVLLGMLSPVPGGAGVREALMAGMAQLEGVPAAPVVLAAVCYRLALFAVTPLVWGMLRMARAPMNRA